MSASEHRLLRLIKMPSIEGHFPIVFANGARMPELKASCARCLHQFSTSNMHGQVSHEDQDDELESYLIEAAVICDECNVIANFFIKVSDDQTMSTMVDGEWVVFQKVARKPADESSPERIDLVRPPSKARDIKKSKLGLLIGFWFGVYLASVYPALQLILAGDEHSFFGIFFDNACLCAIGYACSTMLGPTPKKRSRKG
jgi:hypothetical protein